MAKRKKKEETSRPAHGSAAEPGESSVYRKYPAGLRQEALQRMESGGNLSELARELGVHRNLLYYWRRRKAQAAEREAQGDAAAQRVRELEGRIPILEGSLWRKTLEADFFVSALRRIEGRAPSSGNTGSTASTEKSGNGRQRRRAD